MAVYGADDFAAVDALEVDARDAEVGVSELALNDDERGAFVRHLDSVSVPELVGREATSRSVRTAARREDDPRLFASRRQSPRPSADRPGTARPCFLRTRSRATIPNSSIT
jgi:hypothetical protein